MTDHHRDDQHLADLDHQHVWHPFTPMRQWRQQQPLIIQRGEGEFLIDTDGNRYIDGVSSLWCNVHGHRAQQIDQAIRKQLDQIAHTTLLGLGSPPSIELAARLIDLVNRGRPGDTKPNSTAKRLNKVFYSDAGATALELAFKMAVGYWHHQGQPQKTGFISFTGGYHGDTTGSMSVGYNAALHGPFVSMIFPTLFSPVPDVCRLPAAIKDDFNANHTTAEAGAGCWPSEDHELNDALKDSCLEQLKTLLQEVSQETAAIVIEPVMQGAAGMICQPPGFVRGVAELAHKYQVLLIADEVATGFGRTGEMFACQHDEVIPDILCLAKGLSGGYLPLAATLATDEIEQAFCGDQDQHRTLYHGHTFTGNALGCAAAIASLNLFESTGLLEHIRASAKIMADRLNSLRDCEHVLDVRQRGLMVGIELCPDRSSQQPRDEAKQTGAAMCMAMRNKGLIIRPLGDVLVLMPIPAMPHGSLHRMLDIVIDVVTKWDADGCDNKNATH